MRVFFTASYHGKQKYQKEYDMIIAKLDSMKFEVISPEKANYKSLLTPKEIEIAKDSYSIHYLAIKKGIAWADAVVLEVSDENFQIGHEATLAIQASKHLLCLSLHEDYSKKIKHRFFHASKYNDFSYESTIEEFFQIVQRAELKNRLNLFISDRHRCLLETKAKELNVNKSEYIRILLEKE